MPTTTITAQTTGSVTATIPLKTPPSQPPTPASTTATLRSLYPRAATAFLQRDIVLTHTLLTSAFALISPPFSLDSEDPLSLHRRKWDLLRITFETTLYASPPPSEGPDSLPASLRANQVLLPQSLVSSLYERSLQLFTPITPPQKPSSAFLPPQILITLGLASVKLGCPDVGRKIVEDWLARGAQPFTQANQEGYVKVLDLYCLQLLPRLEEWDYAEDFLKYERDLSQKSRSQMVVSLRALREQAVAARQAPSPSPAPAPLDPVDTRTVSPAPSQSSESSTSTHTATPTSPRLYAARVKAKTKERSVNMARLHSSSSASSSQSVTSVATSATITPSNMQRSRRSAEPEGSRSRNSSSLAKSRQQSASSLPLPPRSQSLDPPSAAVTRSPSLLTVLRSSFSQPIQNLTKSKFTTFVILCVVIPLISFVIRIRRRKTISNGGGAHAGVADSVRKRLHAGALEKKGIFLTAWEEVVRSVVDAVTMGGRGLV